VAALATASYDVRRPRRGAQPERGGGVGDGCGIRGWYGLGVGRRGTGGGNRRPAPTAGAAARLDSRGLERWIEVSTVLIGCSDPSGFWATLIMARRRLIECEIRPYVTHLKYEA
jgi:hypothetical protein